MTEKNTIYLIDGTAYIHRAFHAIRNLSTSKGFPSNAVFGFTRMLIKLMEEKKPQYAAMIFDSKGPTFRHEIYDRYKANRPPMAEEMAVQIPWIKKVSQGFNLPVFEKQGFEADDIIATLSDEAQKAGFDVVMVTGDKDFVQLVTDRAIIWDPMKEVLTDRAAVREKFGIEPPQMLDVQALSGDSSDNIPGVPGIGPKTALDLIRQFKSLEGIYENIGSVAAKGRRQKLIDFKDQAFLSRKLAWLRTDVPLTWDIKSLKAGAPDNNVLAEIFKELEFRALQKDYPVETDLSQKTYQAVTDPAGVKALAEKLARAGIFAIDTETTGLDTMTARLVGMSFSIKENEAFYIPCGHTPASGEDSHKNIDCEQALAILMPVLNDPKIRKIGQNIKFDWAVLRHNGADLAGVFFDTMIASYLLNPERQSHSLDQIALDFFDHKMISYKEATQSEGIKAETFADVPVKKAVPYACEDADITFCAFQRFSGMLSDAGLDRLFETVEMPLVPVLMKMEEAGIMVDRNRLASLSKEFSERLEGIEREITDLAGESFNINSPKQLGCILFEKLKLPVQKKTKKRTGYSTDVEVLTKLAEQHEFPARVLEYRSLSKLKSTYVDALFTLINPETGRIHTSYNQSVTATGRLSSSNPNLQNIPIRTEEGRKIRQAFIPKPGSVFLSADYSQIELRILAHYSDDRILIRAFTEGEDIHTRTAAEVFNADPMMVTSELRRQAKAINFGIIYGMGSYSLSKDLGISVKMAKTFIDNYFFRYSGVKAFIDRTIETARKEGKTGTELGRIRAIPQINSENRNIRAFAERIAVNTPIQGTAADLIKLAMIKMDAEIEKRGLKTAMLLTVHDELVFEVPEDELETMKLLSKDVMENIWQLKVPLKVNIMVGRDWAEAH
ncbi:MAG: DNA polymerase I [Deltaproteobacteria bacterium]|nr:DNA polymerase I [Deltaproteobacteria bacterium]